MIRWEKASLSFKDIALFNNLDFFIKSGEKVLLSNKSGSGKTTLLKTALGLVPLDSGLIFVNNLKLTPHNIERIRASVFYLDQDITLPELNTEELLKEIFLYKENRDKTLDRVYLLELLNKLQLKPDILNKNINELSGGERQRVGLIIGMLLKRPIWLLDEPTSALDKELKEIVTSIIISLPITAIIISHDSCWNLLTSRLPGEI